MSIGKLIMKAMLVALMIATFSASALAQYDDRDGPLGGRPLFKMLAAIGGKMAEINREAMYVYQTLPREGSCTERRDHWLAILPDALLLGRYARDIYDRNHESEMKRTGRTSLAMGPDHFAYFEPQGERYAEVRFDRQRRRAIVIFRGTRLGVRSDLATDVLNFMGVTTGYYEWAASLVGRIVRANQDMEVVATGHSLGGGLALYAVLKNPGVRGFVFNPTGFSEAAWSSEGGDERDRLIAAVTVISTRNFWTIEPVSALSFAGRSVLPGHVFVARSNALRPAKLHTASIVLEALEHIDKSRAKGSVCDGDVGYLAR
jgi:Lipase (class 3)